MARARFSFGDFLWRWAFAQILVFATFNPSEWSYARWAADHLPDALTRRRYGRRSQSH